MKTPSQLWKYALGLLLCAGCCAAPLLIGLGGFAAVAGIVNSHFALLAYLGLPFVFLLVFLLIFLLVFAFNPQRKTKPDCQERCATSCGCKDTLARV